MNTELLTNPHGLPVPSRTAPMREHHPGKAFEHVPADILASASVGDEPPADALAVGPPSLVDGGPPLTESAGDLPR